MEIIIEKRLHKMKLSEFEFHGRASVNIRQFDEYDFEILEWMFSNVYPNGIHAEKLNIIFSYADDLLVWYLRPKVRK